MNIFSRRDDDFERARLKAQIAECEREIRDLTSRARRAKDEVVKNLCESALRRERAELAALKRKL